MDNVVVLKGSSSGLELVYDKNTDFETVLDKLEEKLKSSASFFNQEVGVIVDDTELTCEQKQKLSELFSLYGLKYVNKCQANLKDNDDREDTPQVLIVSRTIRGGQSIEFEGSVFIFGDVNPNAKVVAGGDVVIVGTCRGVVHAGAFGNRQATITADRLMASQLRIADIIACAPDNLPEPQGTERARIVDSRVLIESVI